MHGFFFILIFATTIYNLCIMGKTVSLLFVTVLIMGLSSCEKPQLSEDEPEEPAESGVPVKFSVVGFDQIPFENEAKGTRADKKLKDVCSSLSFAFFTEGGDLYLSKNQQSSENDFGTLSVSLPEGTYQLVVIAHSTNGNPTFESADKVKFKDNKVSDTFSAELNFSTTEGPQHSLTLKRVVSMFRLVTTDIIPSNVKRFKFYYTGGSSSLNGLTGYGCVNSRQTEYRDVTDAMTGKPATFSVYTFPHVDEDELKMVVTALDASGNTVAEHTFVEVPIKPRYITQYKGKFFDETGGQEGDITFTFVFDDTWTEIDHSY